MGRLRTVGFEIALGVAALEGQTTSWGASSFDLTFQTSVVRSGAQAARVNSASTNDALGLTYGRSISGATVMQWNRCYYRFDALPGSAVTIMRLNASLGDALSVKLTSGGKLQLFNDQTSSQIGSDSTQTLATGQWYRIELYLKLGSAGADEDVELRLDGSTIVSATAIQIFGSMPSSLTLQVGWREAPGADKVLYLDDLAINDDQGSSQNSWPGSGKVVYLKPISDSQVGSWTGGAGGTSNLFEAVNNTPPQGSTANNDADQIKRSGNDADDSTTEYRATLTSYLTAGISAADTISLVQAVIDHGEEATSGTKTGDFLIHSNPTQATADTFTFGNDLGAFGTWPSSWANTWGTVQYSPSVTVGTSPVLRVRKTGPTGGPSRVCHVDLMGVYVEYIPAVAKLPKNLVLLPQPHPAYRD